MSREKIIFLVAIFLSIVIFRFTFGNFFAQDDFLLINEFSGGSLLLDFYSSFGPAHVTHWRPFHSLFFLISGNFFDKNYFLYHLFAFSIHVGVGVLIYKVVNIFFNNKNISLFTSFIYLIHPAHLISLYWISGSATTIGFFFLLVSLLFFLKNKTSLSAIFFIIAFLASEAMIVGLPIMLIAGSHIGIKNHRLLFKVAIILILIVIIKFVFLTPSVTYNAYKFEASLSAIGAIKYYLLRVFLFPEATEGIVFRLLLIAFSVSLILTSLIKVQKNNLLLCFLITSLGLFPFIFLPEHLSSHYMNISIFGFSLLIALTLSDFKNRYLQIAVLGLIFLFSYFNVGLSMGNNWVTPRSMLAERYIDFIEKSNLAGGSTIIFNDNEISSSYDAYIALGNGRAIDFWFRNKNYKYCFTWQEACQ